MGLLANLIVKTIPQLGASVFQRWRGPPAAALCAGSFRPMASGAMASARQPSTNSAFCQPQWPISQFSTGTIRNWPKEPAAAATPIAQERRSGATLRPITP